MEYIQQALTDYLKKNSYQRLDLKAILFDMDGVLYDSMPNHASSWAKVMQSHGLNMTEEEAYYHEGRTGDDTINIISQREGMNIGTEERKNIYQEKVNAFGNCPAVIPITGSAEILQKVKDKNLFAMLVTGSGQPSLLDRLNNDFPNTFVRERMVTSFDVSKGKPNPEPYLTALDKGGLQKWEALVVENAPLGVEAAHTAGLFTIAVNTGPLPDSCLLDAGANLLFPSMTALCEAWDTIFQTAKDIQV
ncbi:MAG: HAD hydrolase-like protein [Tannerella sp.]|jgi:beta-phosphoglucomutase-like phosphatase (HAD superfamily)|nr:HAD hydrolase-like protein [Tannerella sp.]